MLHVFLLHFFICTIQRFLQNVQCVILHKNINGICSVVICMYKIVVCFTYQKIKIYFYLSYNRIHFYRRIFFCNLIEGYFILLKSFS